MEFNIDKVLPRLIGINKLRKRRQIPRPILRESLIDFQKKYFDVGDYRPSKDKIYRRQFIELIDVRFDDFIKILSEKSGIVFKKRPEKNDYNFDRPFDAQELGDEWDDYVWSGSDF